MTTDPREQHLKDLIGQINQVIRSKWPETLTEDSDPYGWARENAAELMAKRAKLSDEVDALYLNGAPFDEFKKACKDWGRTELEIFQLHAAELRRKEAA